MTSAKIAFAAAVAAVALTTPALADFQYQGSPKFGEFYIYTSPQVGRDGVITRHTPLNANAAMTNDKTTPFKGGIGNRAP